MFNAGRPKTRTIGRLYNKKYYDNVKPFSSNTERHGSTDGQTNGWTDGRTYCYINIARQCADAR